MEVELFMRDDRARPIPGPRCRALIERPADRPAVAGLIKHNRRERWEKDCGEKNKTRRRRRSPSFKYSSSRPDTPLRSISADQLLSPPEIPVEYCFCRARGFFFPPAARVHARKTLFAQTRGPFGFRFPGPLPTNRF